MASPLVQAALSHYIAKRDKCLAELDVYLNRPVGVGDHASVSDEIIKLFSELDNAESVISTIRDVVSSNQNQVDELRQQILKANEQMKPTNTSVASEGEQPTNG
jgi:peptidoglycan hydrolase CwlO-like protein